MRRPGIATFGARLDPYSEAMLPGATALPPSGLAALTNALEAVVGGGPMLNDIASGDGSAAGGVGHRARLRRRSAIGRVTMLLTKTSWAMVSCE